MSAAELHEQIIKPLSPADKLALALLILNDLAQVLAEARAAWEQEQQDTLAGLSRAQADVAAGRTHSLQETLAGMDATLEAKRQQAAQENTAA